MKNLLLFCLFFGPISLFSQKMFETGEWCSDNKLQLAMAPPPGPDGREDSVSLVYAKISLDMTNVASKMISGSCQWQFHTKLFGVTQLRFDLLGMTVDSVIFENAPVSFERYGEQLLVTLPAPLGFGAGGNLIIYYHGSPQKDTSNWGGFYFEGNYAFNLGVGFDADPHVFGRAWHPCFDNFISRSVYSFHITTKPNQPAYCNGILQSDEATPDGNRLRTWLMDQPIPSYLACVAIGPYTSFQRAYWAENNNLIPVEIAAAAADTVKVRNTFQHLPQAIQAFEHWYGPFQWSKIGYSLVPFNSGAMEHATNIAIGSAYINGSLTYETLWAHELSHHWWGDLATCSTAEDMWLNEGWASYSEHLFTESVYGKQAYLNAVRANFLTVLETAHVKEGGYRAVSGVPHSLTYGDHVYKKGAVVAHNLRGYMGDSLFRQGLRYAMTNNSFTDWSSAHFEQLLETSTGLNLQPFFQNWVFSGGFPDFLIDSSQVSQPIPGQFLVKLFVKQKLRGAPAFHTNVPLEFTFLDEQHNRINRSAVISGENSEATFVLNFNPVHIFVNTNLKITQARGDGEKVFKSTGSATFQDAKMSINAYTIGADSVLVRTEHHYSTPDNAGANPNGYQLTNRFWQIFGNFPTDFDAQATVTYDGRLMLDQLDTELFDATGPSEDSIVVLYRPGAGYPWLEWPTYTKVTLSSTTDKFGQLRIMHIKPGQYTIGKGASALNTRIPENALGNVEVSPNPASNTVRVHADKPFNRVQLFNLKGITVLDTTFEATTAKNIILEKLPAGQYWLTISGPGGRSTNPLVKF